MEAIIITKADLNSFRDEIIREFTKIVNNKQNGQTDPWLRTRDVCKLLNLSTSTLQNLRNAGKIPFKKLNGTILYRRADIESLLENYSNEGGIK
jgi:excisionase family DNA binding protein